MNAVKVDDSDLAGEALDWLIRLRFDEVSSEVLSAWILWLEHDSAREAYDAALEVWSLGGLAQIDRASERDLRADRYDAAVPVAAWLDQAKKRPGYFWPIAAALIIAMGGVLGWDRWNARDSEPVRALATMRAEHHDARLSDGSQIRLGAMSAVNVSYSRHRRAVSLEHGEALFEVAHDRSRPFVVSTPLAQVTAVGTAFNIDIDGPNVELFVTEGVVEVDPSFQHPDDKPPSKGNLLQIRAGQRLQIDGETKSLTLYEAGASPSRTWREGRLEYRDEPLQSVIQDVNRYALHPIRLREASIGKLTYTGTVLLSAADSWVYGLAGAFPVSVLHENGDIMLTRAVSSNAVTLAPGKPTRPAA